MSYVGLIPAAGRGSRLAPLPGAKELFPIGYQDYEVDGTIHKRPKVISQFLIEQMVKAGAERLFVVLGEYKYEIMHYYGDGSRFGVDIAYLYQEQLSGMPYALDLAHPWLSGEETVLFGMPDTIVAPGECFERMLVKQADLEADLVLGAFVTNTPTKFGMVSLSDTHDVLDTIDKPQDSSLKYMWGNACWGGRFSGFMHEYLAQLPSSDTEVVLGDVFNAAIQADMKVVAEVFDDGHYMDIGTVEELDAALKKFHL